MGKGKRRRGAADTRRPPRPYRPSDLLEGVRGPGQTRLRLVRPDDLDDLARLLELTGEKTDPEVFDGIASGAAASLVLAGLGVDRDVLLQRTAPMLSAGRGLYDVIIGLMTALIAEDNAGRKVGAFLAYPPAGVLAQIGEAGVPLPQLVVTALKVTKIARLAVDEDVRGHGVGSALLKHGTTLYLQLGYFLIYGHLVTGRGLESYYGSRGFTILGQYERVPLDVILGYPVSVGPDEADQRILARWR